MSVSSVSSVACVSSAASGRDVALLDLADRLLERGVSISGDIVISVADVDLVYVSLRALVASVETAMALQLGQDIEFR
jgi:hypothetical protein